ncbi:hypothetical protein [Polluticoccus soli]|uniref:hypothetical protein n=1 Tax=Polluticoccus soli TaxID=3034150 RepID=UPI0023E10138|nr:hypothetical protein [Flavipsychrobacter sp. JY13-12]
MSQKNELITQPFNRSILGKRILIGAIVALALMMILIGGVEGRPEWGAYWKIRPLVVITLAGATGGACSYLIERWIPPVGWRKVLVISLSLIVYLFGLWMGTVLGLNGTMWN